MSIKKRVVIYGLIGFLIGPFISTLFSLCYSYIHASEWGWVYSPVAPAFISVIGNQLNAFTVQFLLSAVMGAGFSMAAVIWQVERWSYTKQIVLHFLALMATMFPIAYFLEWMEHSLSGFLLYFGIFVAVYLIYWCVYTIIMRVKIRKMNEKLKKNK